MATSVGEVPDTSAGLYQCGDCKRSYTRLDHLSRHVRSHTHEKPYICQVCAKAFARVDLLKRHAEGHKVHDNIQDGSPKRQKRRSPANSTRRVAEACEACVKVHLRCEAEKPCSRCQKKQIPCRAPTRSSGGVAEKLINPLPATDDLQNGIQNLKMDYGGAISSPQLDLPVIAHHTSHEIRIQENQDLDLSAFNGSGMALDLASESAIWALPDFLRNLVPPMPIMEHHHGLSISDQQAFSGTRTPAGVLDFGLDFDLAMDDTDFGFLDTYNLKTPFEHARVPVERGAEMSQDGVVLRMEAFGNSTWRFKPSQEDCSAAEEINLTLPPGQDSASSPESLIGVGRKTTLELLPPSSRDQILSLILSTCKPNNIARTVTAFPSLGLLDGLLHYYLTSPLVEIRRWLHVPTFFPVAQNKSALLTALIAAGAVLTPDSSLRKLGFAFHEAARQRVIGDFEEDNTMTRNLQNLQAYMILRETGLWSGNSRKMEIASSFVQPLVIILRRSGRFRRHSYIVSPPSVEDYGEVLEEKWRSWVNQESFSRLVFHLYQHDAQASMALLAGPIISYAELHLPLPDDPSLWEAADAETWKSRWLSRLDAPARRPTLVDCMNDFAYLSTSNQYIDIEQASIACLYAHWALVWEYRQLRSTMKAQSGHTLLLQSRHQELMQTLKYLRLSCDGLTHQIGSPLAVVFEIIFMHLHMSMEDLQLFAGLEGQQESQRVYPSLREWVTKPSSRQAIWHAGQVIKTARASPSASLRDFYAVAVYHASLAFWTFGLISGVQKRHHTGEKDHTRPIVWLDATESTDTQRYIGLSRGSPAIHCAEATDLHTMPAYIDEPGAVMNVVIGIMRQNYDVVNESRPPLVENLIQLMCGLRAAATAPRQGFDEGVSN